MKEGLASEPKSFEVMGTCGCQMGIKDVDLKAPEPRWHWEALETVALMEDGISRSGEAT